MKQTGKAAGLRILCVFLLSACETIENSPHENTIKGAGAGAATGAVAGAILGDDKDDIIIGTAAGAVIGGILGSSAD